MYMNNIDWSAFSHGQIQSKIWLCEKLEPHIGKHSYVAILGCWYNILGFMLQVRQPHNYYNEICGMDIDSEALRIANNINQAFLIGEHPTVRHIKCDVNTTNLKGYDVIINCSAEHMTDDRWFDNIPEGRLVCIQNTNLDIKEEPWLISNPTQSLEKFVAKYTLKSMIYNGQIDFNYNTFGYSRYMIIGYK